MVHGEKNTRSRHEARVCYKGALISFLFMGILLCVYRAQAQFGGKKLILLQSPWAVSEEEFPGPLTLDTITETLMNPEAALLEKLRNLNSQDGEAKMAEPSKWRTVRMRVTAYCPCRKCCGRNADGITACNHRIRKGDVFVAADKSYRFGTEMIIPGYNNEHAVPVMDRGRLIKGNRLDVFIPSHAQAKKWGVKYLDVLVREK